MVWFGVPQQIAKFRKETTFDGEIYVDPQPDLPVAYKGFKLCGGRERLLDSNVLQALGTTTTAQLWASAVELLEDGDVTQLTVTSFGQSLVRVSGEIAAALFASAFGL